MVKCRLVNQGILRWARETAGYELEDICAKSPFKKVAEWEDGRDYPTYPQLEGLASKYKRPLALFFFPEIPEEENIESSFRTLPDLQIKSLPPPIRFILRKGRGFQINLHELTGSKSPAKYLITDSLKFHRDRDARKMVKETRKFLGINLSEQKKWLNPSQALKKWREALADKGIFVFKDAFNCNDYSGFCLYDDRFPIIFVNNSLSKTRQIFTLFHELAHLIFRMNHLDMTAAETGILDSVPSRYKKIEQLCNRFSAEFLVPSSDFAKEVEKSGISESTISEFAKSYSVSREVILRRMLDDGHISKSCYDRQLSVITSSSKRKSETSSSGGDYYRTKISYLGEVYLKIVFEKYLSQEISLEETAEYLDIKPLQVDQIEALFLSSK